MKTNVYVDGFNLYYGSLKDTPYRWLDIAALCANILPNNIINRIRYFTWFDVHLPPIRLVFDVAAIRSLVLIA